MLILPFLLPLCLSAALAAAPPFQTDTLPTSAGDLQITFIGHASLMFRFAGKVIQVDPVSAQADYRQLPKADLILVTHEHSDHFDPEAIAALAKPGTVLAYSAACAEQLPGGIVLGNGDARELAGIPVAAVPAYNILHKRPDGTPFHPKGRGNGYVLTFGGTRVLVAGDTEDTPELKALKHIDVAFLPANLPYTMTPEMVAAAAKALAPKIFYPYHLGDTDTGRIVALMADTPGIEVRIRRLQ